MTSERVRQPWLDPLVSLADDRFRIPGTQIRYGLDAVIGAALPVVGDSITTALGAIVLVVAWKDGAPLSVLARMGANLAIDAAVGAIPVVGDLIDVGFRANRRNHALLRAFQHQEFGTPLPSARADGPQGRAPARPTVPSRESERKPSWLVGGVLVILVVLLVALPLALLVVLGTWAL